MARINEHEIFASYIGEKVNEHRLGPISRHNGNGYGDYADSKEYIISHVDYYDVKEYREVFGLTSVLTERWNYKGIDFRIYIYIRDGVITGGHVFKYITISESCHFRPIGYETDATQQELCVVERILAYITK